MAMIRVMFGSVGSDGSEEAASHDRQMDEIVDSREGRQGFRVEV